jgi:TPR repeat protein
MASCSHRFAEQGSKIDRRKLLLATIALAAISAPGMSNAASSSRDAGLESLKRSCEAGVLDDCNRVGTHFMMQRLERSREDREGIKHDYTEATRYYEKACNGGSAVGCNEEGFVFDLGEYSVGEAHITGGSAKAAELYKKACDGSCAKGCESLARKYENGSGGLPQNPAVAAELYRRAASLYQVACDRGDETSCAGVAPALAAAARLR